MPTFVTRTDVSPGTTGSWQDVSLSALIPSGATGVILRAINTSVGPQAAGWRKKGSTDNRTTNIRALSQGQAIIGVDASRVLQLYCGDAAVQFLLEAYFGSEAVFFDNAVSKTPSGGFSWTTISIASDTGADTAVAALLELNATWVGLRKTGSTDNRPGNYGTHAGAIVGLDGSEQFDFQADAGTSAAFVVGYMKSGATIATSGTDRSTATTGSYVDLAAFGGGVAGLYEVSSTGGQFALRKKGDASDLYYEPGLGDTWMVIEGDGSLVTQQKIASTTIDVFELGYLTAAVVGPPPPPVLLSLPGVQDITSTSARPKVTITY